MTIFSCNNLSKSFKDEWLFEGLSFGMEEGDKIGVIGRNGIGKTTLLNIIAGIEQPESGSVVYNNKVRFRYLEQLSKYDSSEVILDLVMKAKPEIYEILEEHHRLCNLTKSKNDNDIPQKIESIISKLNDTSGWNLENEAKAILSRLGIENFYDNVNTLSGGLKKRVFLAQVLLSEPELLILDEPTNHLDADSVQWLQDKLQNSANSIIFVTHDRYFLDAVSNKIIEIDQKKLFSYPGNYEKYLERKEAFVQAHNATVEHIKSRLRVELAWLQKGAKARRTKQKSRIDWIEWLKTQTKSIKEKNIKIELGKTFIGSRIIDAHHISKSIAGKKLFEDFTYIAKPGDRIGIIGPNGSGKSTLLNVLSAKIKPDEGIVKIGESIRVGYCMQENIDLKENQSVIGSLREVAEYIDVGEGRDRYLTAKDLLNKFLFAPNQHNALIGTLSGGERRRLAILKIFMNNPNVILLDEPTNDLDIPTLNAIEEYLENFYGVLLVVSHDRAFLDRTVDFIWAFDGKGNIKEYPGNYSVYLEKIESENKLKSQQNKETTKINKWKNVQQSKKLSYKAQIEFEELEEKIPELESEKKNLEELINSGKIEDYKEVDNICHKIVELETQIEESTLRWLELAEKIE